MVGSRAGPVELRLPETRKMVGGILVLSKEKQCLLGL